LKNLRSIGSFSKIIKNDGTLLFSCSFRDNDFLLGIKTIYHVDYLTAWTIESIKKVSKGFHIKLKGVDDTKSANYFTGETFGVEEEKIKGLSIDLIIGTSLFDCSGNQAGEIISVTKTPGYYLAEIRGAGNRTFFVPLTDEFTKVSKDGKIILLREIK